MVARSVCAVLLNPRRSKKSSSVSSALPSRNASNPTPNVVQTRPLPELILSDLAAFQPGRDELRLALGKLHDKELVARVLETLPARRNEIVEPRGSGRVEFGRR